MLQAYAITTEVFTYLGSVLIFQTIVVIIDFPVIILIPATGSFDVWVGSSLDWRSAHRKANIWRISVVLTLDSGARPCHQHWETVRLEILTVRKLFRIKTLVSKVGNVEWFPL